MALSEDDIKTLQEIVDTEGACMLTSRCAKCPFKVFCLPEFLFPENPSQAQRYRMALDVLTHHSLIDEDMSQEDINKYNWKQ